MAAGAPARGRDGIRSGRAFGCRRGLRGSSGGHRPGDGFLGRSLRAKVPEDEDAQHGQQPEPCGDQDDDRALGSASAPDRLHPGRAGNGLGAVFIWVPSITLSSASKRSASEGYRWPASFLTAKKTRITARPWNAMAEFRSWVGFHPSKRFPVQHCGGYSKSTFDKTYFLV